ncbi:MAG: amidohydrolase [Candidatus Pelagibacterales bacterium]|jgi:amidohydrolase|tara:strand:+ start:729 stop:1883 length:1155 start_codon:yes stop_codon:yes gene_type:complete
MLTKKFENELKQWRHDFHACPELNFDVNQTAKKVAKLLKEFGLEVHTGIGGTGIVGTLKKGTGSKSIGIRADMDALPINELNDFPYKSKNEGKMHACGHDGHTAMALGAAKFLAESGDFDGTVHFIFQPDEEATEGAQAMIDDGLFKNFNIDEVYAFHNLPGLAAGNFASRAGAITGSESLFEIKLHGRGGHSALPHMGVDTITVGTQIITALQSIVSRKINPALNGVVSVTEFISDGKKNILPGESIIIGDTRALSLEANKIIEDSMRQIVEGLAKAHNIEFSFSYDVQTQMTINTPDQVHAAIEVAKNLVGKDLVDGDCEPKLFSEDFAQMLAVKPGCYILIGNGIEGNHGRSLHSADYDFNDELLVVGSSFWSELVLKQLS